MSLDVTPSEARDRLSPFHEILAEAAHGAPHRLRMFIGGELAELPGPAEAARWYSYLTELLARTSRDDAQEALRRVREVLVDIMRAASTARRDRVNEAILVALDEREGTRDDVRDRVGFDLTDEQVYWALKALREPSEFEIPLVVAQGRPLRYKLAGDPDLDQKAGWRGISTSGVRLSATDAEQLDGTLLRLIEGEPGIGLATLQSHDDLSEHSNSRVYWSLRTLRDNGEVVAKGRPMRFYPVPQQQSTDMDPTAGPVGTELGLDPQERDRRDAAAQRWMDDRQANFEELERLGTKWLGRVLESPEVRDFRIDARVKDLTRLQSKLNRACGDLDKLCRSCLALPVRRRPNEVHFYYAGSVEEVLQQIDDYVGMRVIVPGTAEREQVEAILAPYAVEGAQEIGADDRVPGYRATHFVLTLPADGAVHEVLGEIANLRFEVQVRTVLQDAGARIQHALVYKEGEQELAPLTSDEYRLLRTIFGQMEVAEREFDRLVKARHR